MIDVTFECFHNPGNYCPGLWFSNIRIIIENTPAFEFFN